jgi:hypothetical protein
MREKGKQDIKGGQLTIGLDLRDRSSYYCVLDAAGAPSQMFGAINLFEEFWRYRIYIGADKGQNEPRKYIRRSASFRPDA